VIAGVNGVVRLGAGAVFADAFRRVAPTWPYRETGGRTRPLIAIRADGTGYRIESPWLDEPATRSTAAAAVCAFLVELVYASLGETDLCLHCGAVEMGGGLIVFPSTYRAGKSTLIAALAASGVRVHADDLMPLTMDGEGVALGINPRLRWPLPRNAPERLRAFVARYSGPRDRRYQYLDLPEPLLSPYGERRPVRAIVTLNRTAAGGARLVALPRGSAARQLILQHFGRGSDARQALDRLLSIVAPVPSFRLDCADLGDAVRVLKRAFAGKGLQVNRSSPPQGATADPALEPLSGRLPPGRFFRRAGVAVRTVDGAAFLAEPGTGGIFELNPVGHAVWELLATPVSPEDIAAVLSEAFLSVQADTIRSDVDAILRQLWNAGLIDRAATAGATPRRRATPGMCPTP
jgi:hypothetical protein